MKAGGCYLELCDARKWLLSLTLTRTSRKEASRPLILGRGDNLLEDVQTVGRGSSINGKAEKQK